MSAPTCAARIGKRGRACLAPAVQHIRLGCVHEHVYNSIACATHATQATMSGGTFPVDDPEFQRMVAEGTAALEASEAHWASGDPPLWQVLEAADPRIRQELLNAWDARDEALAAVSRVRELAEQWRAAGITSVYESADELAEMLERALDGDQ